VTEFASTLRARTLNKSLGVALLAEAKLSHPKQGPQTGQCLRVPAEANGHCTHLINSNGAKYHRFSPFVGICIVSASRDQ